MNLHEYQAKSLFRAYGIPVPAGEPAKTPEKALEIAQTLGGNRWVVKAQVHSGGRGKAGGVDALGKAQSHQQHLPRPVGLGHGVLVGGAMAVGLDPLGPGFRSAVAAGGL